MKNKHTLANKKLQKLNKQYPSIPTPGSTEPNEAFQILEEKSIRALLEKTPIKRTKWWQKLLKWITFGLYKPTTFWYKIKPIKK